MNDITDIGEHELHAPANRKLLSRTDRSAYVAITLKLIVALGIVGALAAVGYAMLPSIWILWVLAAVVAYNISRYAYEFLLLKARTLYIDNDGLWMRKGVLPWSKGIYGLEWRDMGNTAFFNDGIWNWAFKTGTLVAYNRYKNGYSMHFEACQNPNEVAAEVRAARDRFSRR